MRSTLFAAAATLAMTVAGAARAEPVVVASIKPVHSLVSAVMQGVGTPRLLVDGAASPHVYALKPSQAAMLQDADVVFWIGEALETFLTGPVSTIAARARSVSLLDADGVRTLPARAGGTFDEHRRDDHDEHRRDDHDEHRRDDHDEHRRDDHDEHRRDDHDEHRRDDHDEHRRDDHDEHRRDDHDEHRRDDHDEHRRDDHDEHRRDDHDEHRRDDHDEHRRDDHDEHRRDDHDEHGGDRYGDHDDHAHGGIDSHIWLDPVNARAMVRAITTALSAADPVNAAAYRRNAETTMAALDGLIAEVRGMMAPVTDKQFVVFHDAYQYFEQRFGLAAAGSITVSPEVMPGASRISEIRAWIAKTAAVCVFAEPQFEPRLMSVVVEGTAARSGVLDPLGATLPKGSMLYSGLIRGMAASLRDCLARAR